MMVVATNLNPFAFGAIRVRNPIAITHFDDKIKGTVHIPTDFAAEDFIIKRSDGLYAYQLAVVIDDAFQQITEVVRAVIYSLQQADKSVYFTCWVKRPLIGYIYLWPVKKKEENCQSKIMLLRLIVISLNTVLIKRCNFLGQKSVTLEADPRIMLAQAIAQFEHHNIPPKRKFSFDNHCFFQFLNGSIHTRLSSAWGSIIFGVSYAPKFLILVTI